MFHLPHRKNSGDQAEAKERHHGILTQGTSSFAEGITDAIVIKDWNLFFLVEPDGQIPPETGHGLGLYYHDCRYLNGYQLKIGGESPTSLGKETKDGYKSIFQLTNPELKGRRGNKIEKESIGIRWERLLDNDSLGLFETITIQNFSCSEAEFSIELEFQAKFEDLFLIRRACREDEEIGHLFSPKWERDSLNFSYEGKDKVFRSLTVVPSLPPSHRRHSGAVYDLKLRSRETYRLDLSFFLEERRDETRAIPRHHTLRSEALDEKHRKALAERPGGEFRVRSSSVLLERVISRSVQDLLMLESRIDGEEYLAAGVPWFVTLFGRDAIIASLFALGYANQNAANTLDVLARYQGKEKNSFKEEAPGKIPHELRVGELANLGWIPHTPYYGSIDSTPLFLWLIARQAAWTGDLTTFERLKSNIRAALDWIETDGDPDRDGYLEYSSQPGQGLVNQGWKDSGDAIVNSDGSLAKPPISLVEVQGYVYAAKNAIAELFLKTGDNQRAEQLQNEAAELKIRFNRDFWMKDKNLYALALDKDKRHVDAATSNPGHLLWAGIADPEKARPTVERLMSEDFFSGWGLRTLSSREVRYNPMSYHLGSVWPHDNAIFAAGLRRYGFREACEKIFTGLFEACIDFPYYRLPELFSGFGKNEHSVPVRYPVACHPQAWSSGTPLYFLTVMLGLEPNGFEKRLEVRSPILPAKVDFLELLGLQVAGTRIDLRFDRTAKGIDVTVLKKDGPLVVVVSE